MLPLSSKTLFVCLALTSSVLAIEYDDILHADDSSVGQKNTCAMTQVLQAMNELLTVLSGEIRDLKKQVQSNCAGKAGPRPIRPPKVQDEYDGRQEIDEEVDEEVEASEKEDDIFDSFGRDRDSPLSGPDDDEGATEDGDPAGELIDGLSGWLDNIFVPFAQPTEAPTTTTTTRPPSPIFPDIDAGRDSFNYGQDTYDGDDQTDDHYDEYEYPIPDIRYEERHDPTSPSRPILRPYFTTTTTTTAAPSYDIPPEPTTCPAPFRLQAGGCYLVFHDQRDWKSWGEAHAFCQSYGGSLAAPYRLERLQQFLSRYYSDAFWVGGRYDQSSLSWIWLSGRKIEASTWNPGQPSSRGSKYCAYLEKWSNYKANNHFCGEKYPFICDYREQQ